MIKLEAGKQLVSYDSLGVPGISSGEEWDHKGQTELSHIYVSHDDDCIRFIQFQYVENEYNGDLSVLSPMPPPKNSYGWKFNVVKLDYPREFLKGISGYWNRNVTSLTFTTNRRTYGPFGHKQEDDDQAFDLQTADEPLFGGFHGSFDDRGLTTIGMYVDTDRASM